MTDPDNNRHVALRMAMDSFSPHSGIMATPTILERAKQFEAYLNGGEEQPTNQPQEN